MDPKTIQNVLTVLQNYDRMTPDKQQKAMQMANSLRNNPNLPPQISGPLFKFLNNQGGRPTELHETTVQNDKSVNQQGLKNVPTAPQAQPDGQLGNEDDDALNRAFGGSRNRWEDLCPTPVPFKKRK
jgi:hypothetical protein